MYFLGVFFAIGAPVVLMLTSSGRGFITTTYMLSPEITVLILIGYAYPLILFAFSYFSKNHNISRKFYQSQVTLGSTLCVSLGLIGTFIGLSSMVAAISSGMNADGDFSSKINMLLSSIGSSLDSMSLAFLTSILGVGSSTVLSVSCNYLAFYYKTEEKILEDSAASTREEPNNIMDAISDINAKKITEAIDKALDLQILTRLSELISENNKIQKKLLGSLNNFESTQKIILNNYLKSVPDFSDRVVEQMSKNNNNLQNLQGTLERFDSRFQGCVESIDTGLENISNTSYRIATEMDTANSNLIAVHNSLDGLQHSYHSNASSFNQLMDSNTQCIESLSSIMFDVKFLLAPPLNETLAEAIKNDALDIRYQSQVNSSNSIIGCEVLLQWKDPIRGVISNADIFGSDMAKYPELMIELDRWVMNNSIKQLSEWLRDGAWEDHWVLSINVVPQMAKDLSLVSYLRELVDQYSINPANMAIEFKESIVRENIDLMKEIFTGIHDIGAKVYVDNYGKSYSSLVIYQRLKVDKLKIDRSVINDLIDEDGDTSVVRSIMASAKELDLDLIVEGVENDIQKIKLEELGFDHFQGFFVSHPIKGVEYL